MPANTFRPPQFGLATLLGVLVTCCVIFGLAASMTTTYEIVLESQRLPPDDAALTHWLESQDGVENVVVSRQGNVVTASFSKRHGGFDLLTPPLIEFGYLEMNGLSSSVSRPSLFAAAADRVARVPGIVWFAGGVAAMVLLLVQLTRRRKAQSTERAEL